MKIVIRAYKSNNLDDGETITVILGDRISVCCAWDIDRIIETFDKAKKYALSSEVGDEPAEFSIEF